MDTITLINGNGNPVTKELPKILLIGHYNEVALDHIRENTGLNFQETSWNGNYSAQPENAYQIVALFMTYNFKTRYYDNWNSKNTIILKSDHHVGWDIDSICYDCAKENGLMIDIKPGDRLAC